jgi:hypothetical protein
MFQASFGITTTTSDQAFKKWATQLRKDSLRRQKQGLLTNGSDYLSLGTQQTANWATPNTMDVLPPRSFGAMKKQAQNGGRKNRRRPGNLREQVNPLMQQAYNEARAEANNWPTPTTQEISHVDAELTDSGRRKAKGKGESHSLNLQDKAANWPTPSASSGGTHTGITEETARKELERGNQIGLGAAASMWPTPIVGDAHLSSTQEAAQKRIAEGKPTLSRVVEAKNWPTPTTAEAGKISNRPNYGQQGLSNHPAIVGKPDREKMAKSRGGEMGISTNPDSRSTPQGQATTRDGSGSSNDGPNSPQLPAKKDTMCSPKCRRLNANFAAHLMGLPQNFLTRSCCGQSGMGSFRSWQLLVGATLARMLSRDA